MLLQEHAEVMTPLRVDRFLPLPDPGQWQAYCAIQKVAQTESDPYGCGVACLAMVSGITFAEARAHFISLGLGIRRSHRAAFSTSSREMRTAIASMGIMTEARRWCGWEQFHGVGVLKVRDDWRGAINKWHWVVAFRHPTLDLAIFDPHMTIPAFKKIMLEGTHLPFAMYEPKGEWFQVEQRVPIERAQVDAG